MGKYKFSKRSVKNIQTVDSILQELAARTIENSEVDFGVLDGGGLRTAQYQNNLYQKGRTKPGNIVTHLDGYRKISYHQTGLAIDFVVFKDGKPTWKDIDDYKELFKVIYKVWDNLPYSNEYKLIWGGNWKWKDYPHYELRKKI